MQAIFANSAFFAPGRYDPAMQRGRKPSNEAPSFGQQLAHFRKARGLTQQELAETLGISRDLVGHYERRCQNPNLDFVLRVAQVFEVSVDELLGFKPPKPRSGPPPRVKTLAERLTQLPKSKQSVVLEMLEGFLEKAES
jgi:transcriptional regulator with XRE-family HTH domain